MKQILQNLANGETQLVDVPMPGCGSTSVRIRTANSLISLGTERMLVDFGKANLLQKARQQPEKVKMVLEKAGTDGVAATYDAVKSKLNQPLPMGYCNVGTVIDGHDSEFSAGDRVVSNGPHAEYVCISRNLTARIPDSVSFDAASFVPVAAIGLQGIRLVSPELGDSVVVMGLGLIGLMTVQMLIAQGCRVIGTDFDPAKLALARSYGATTIDLSSTSNPVAEVEGFTDYRGADSVIITASTKSSEPISQAARMCRQRGSIVLVGVIGLEIDRADFYAKELSFQVSCSYGPGRYDPFHEEQGHDYPIGFVRWTEKRNFQAVLELMASGRLDVEELISGRYAIEDAQDAYQRVTSDKTALGILLDYPADPDAAEVPSGPVSLTGKSSPATAGAAGGQAVCGVIGAGNYASRILIPAMKGSTARLRTLVSSGGVSAAHHGKLHGFEQATSDSADVFNDDDVNLVVVATRHNTHADLVHKAVTAGKHVFVEKPLVLTRAELDTVVSAVDEQSKTRAVSVMVGFNRRFAPQIVKMKSLLEPVAEPKCFIMTMNAGAIPADSWVQDPAVGGGRIIGEACHYIDLMRHLAGCPIVSVDARRMGPNPMHAVLDDKASITLGFEDGSLGTIHYYANGGKSFQKERIEVFCRDAVLQLDNFRKLQGFGWNGFKKMNLFRQDKGQDACIKAFIESVSSGSAAPIGFDELVEVSSATLDAAEQLSAQDDNTP